MELRKAAALIQAGKRLSGSEERLCIDHFNEFIYLLRIDYVKEYFIKNSLNTNSEFEKLLFEHSKKYDTPQTSSYKQISKSASISSTLVNDFVEIKHSPDIAVPLDKLANPPSQSNWRSIIIGLLLTIIGFSFAVNFHNQLTPASVSVSGYYKRDGTYINPYKRRPPNSVNHDNPYEAGMFFFGFIGLVGSTIVAIKLYPRLFP